MINDDVADVYADTVDDLLLVGYARIPDSHGTLHFYRKEGRIDDAAKFHEYAVAHELDSTAMILRRFRLDQLSTVGFERSQRPRLVGSHEAAITNHVGSENGG